MNNSEPPNNVITWEDLKDRTPWTLTKRNIMKDRIQRMVTGQITDKMGMPISASPVS